MSVRSHTFEFLHKVIQRWPWSVLMVVLITVGGAGYWLATGNLQLNSSRNGTVSADHPEMVRLLSYQDRFVASNDVVVLFEGNNLSALRKSANQVAKRLEQVSSVATVFYRVNLNALAGNGLYFLEPRALKSALHNIQMLSKIMTEGQSGKKLEVSGLGSAASELNKLLDKFTDGETGNLANSRPTQGQLDEGVDLAVSLIDEIRAWMEDPKRQQLGLRSQFIERRSGLTLDEEGYLVGNNGRALLMRISSNQDMVDDKYAKPLIAAIREAGTNGIEPGVTFGITGVPALIVEEQEGFRSDLPMSGMVSFVGCLLVFLIAYRSVLATVAVFLPLAVGLLWSLALFSVLVGPLNVITSPMAVILIGMGIDFSVHLFTRIREERKGGIEAPVALRRGLLGAGPPIVMGAMTSAAAFAAMVLVGIQATQEMGILASTGLVLVMIATFLLLPMLVGRQGTRFAQPKRDSKAYTWQWPKQASYPIIGAGILVTVGFAASIKPIEFNFDVNSYLPAESPALNTLNKLKKTGIGGIEYAVTQSETLEDAQAQYQQLMALVEDGGVAERIESIFDVLPPDLEIKEPLVAEIRSNVSRVPRLKFSPGSTNASLQLVPAVDDLLENLSNWVPARLIELGEKQTAEKLKKVVPALKKLQATLKRLSPEDITHRLGRLETRLEELSGHLNTFLYDAKGPLHPRDLPESLVSAFFVERDGKSHYAIRVYPSGDIADPDFTQRFTAALRAVDSEATGYAITYVYFGVIMKEGLKESAFWAAAVVLLLLFVDLRSPRDVLLASIPLVMGGVWMVGLMNVLGIEYTYSNTLSIPLIMGIGIDSGIHVLHRFKECGDVGRSVLTTGKAILVSSLTTICAFGSLVMVNNSGVQTLGITLILGVGACLVTALIFLPAVLSVIKHPATIRE